MRRAVPLCITLFLSCLLMPDISAGFTIELPKSAVLTKTVERGEEVYDLPSGPFVDGKEPVVPVTGRFLQRSWRIIGTSLTTVQIIAPERAALQAAGFDILLDCATSECGGFDFRFATQVLPAPAMFVDIFHYRFLSALHPDGRAVSIFASVVSEDAYVQIIQISPAGGKPIDVKTVGQVAPAAKPPAAKTSAKTVAEGTAGTIADALLTQGSAPLDDLRLASGSDQLDDGEYKSLEALAAFLKADPTRRVAIVGHTDAVGGLSANIALSKRRAASVVARLKTRYQVPANQIEAEGMGYLSPRASNLTTEGRQENRRVVAVLLNTE